MPHMETEDFGAPGTPTPAGYEGHVSTGCSCKRCGAWVKGSHWVKVHDAWHEQLDGR